MKRQSRENPAIREFILKHIADHPSGIISLVVEKFGISRVAAGGYMQRLVESGILTAHGNTQKRRYALKKIAQDIIPLRLSKNLEEDVIWRYKILPHLSDVAPNIIDICQYGFTEMLNNAIDHSASMNGVAGYSRTYNNITFDVLDEGVGIFEKIQRDFRLADAREALLELSKGKLTSDPEHHAGEGIFFTSRMFDSFSITSGFLFYNRTRSDGDEWLIESGDLLNYHKGTMVSMTISTDADWSTKDIFNQFAGDRPRFRKTHVPVSLGQYAGEALVSRSQAKRILARFDKFSEVMLDFKNVKSIGQPFADEIFRVFKNAHPNIRIVAVNASPDIKRMITFVQTG